MKPRKGNATSMNLIGKQIRTTEVVSDDEVRVARGTVGDVLSQDWFAKEKVWALTVGFQGEGVTTCFLFQDCEPLGAVA